MIISYRYHLLASGLVLGIISYKDYIDRPVQTFAAAASYGSLALTWRLGRLHRQASETQAS